MFWLFGLGAFPEVEATGVPSVESNPLLSPSDTNTLLMLCDTNARYVLVSPNMAIVSEVPETDIRNTTPLEKQIGRKSKKIAPARTNKQGKNISNP